jgi:hypothetical protein
MTIFNPVAHTLLTDQGAYVHTHFDDTFEDVGDAENGPELTGGPAFDEYSGESHYLIIDHTTTFVHQQERDFAFEQLCAEWAEEWGDF